VLLTELSLFTRDSLKSLIRLVCSLAVHNFFAFNLRETWTWSWKPRRCSLLLVDVTHLAIVPFHLFTVLVWPVRYNRSREKERPGGYRITIAKDQPFSAPPYTRTRKSAQVCTFAQALWNGYALWAYARFYMVSGRQNEPTFLFLDRQCSTSQCYLNSEL